MDFSCVGRNKITQACPESFGYAQEGLVEGRSPWWRFRHSGPDAKSVCLSDYVRCAGNANSRCRSNRLIPTYRAVEFASNVFSEACSVWEVEKESHGLADYPWLFSSSVQFNHEN
jgi:hypothetical protein